MLHEMQILKERRILNRTAFKKNPGINESGREKAVLSQ